MHRQHQRQQVSEIELALLGAALKDGQSSFLVKHNGSFIWAIICLDSLARGQLRFYFTMFATTEVPFSAVILSGTDGAQRTLSVIHPLTGENVCARYIRFVKETYEGDTPIAHFLFEVRVTGEKLIIPINKILARFPTDIEKKAFDAVALFMLEQRFLAAKAEDVFKAEKLKAAKDFELRELTAQEQSRFPLILPRPEKNPVVYPFLKEIDIRVLFLLLENLGVAFKSSYEFNLTVIRFLACGSQENFLEDFPGLSDEEEMLFKNFVENYNRFFMGNPMTSRMQRFSSLTVQEVFLAESQRARLTQVRSKCALRLPSEYFTGPEPGVEDVREGHHDLFLHGSLFKLEKLE